MIVAQIRRFKRYLWIAALLFSAFLLPCTCKAAAEQPDFSVESVEGVAGKTVEVSVTVSHNPGILGAVLTLKYDDRLTLTDARLGEAFSSHVLTKPGAYASPCCFVLDALALSEQEIRDGTVLVFCFAVPKNLPDGSELPIQLSVRKGDVVDRNLQTLTPNLSGGGITVHAAKCLVDGLKATLRGGTVEISLNSTERCDDALVLIVAYETDGRMTGCSAACLNLNSGKGTYTVDAGVKGERLRLSVLSHTMQPIGSAVWVT